VRAIYKVSCSGRYGRGYFILHTFFHNDNWRKYFIMVVTPYKEVGLNWNQCVKIYTDYSPALLGAL
jgi:hypothetical protein